MCLLKFQRVQTHMRGKGDINHYKKQLNSYKQRRTQDFILGGGGENLKQGEILGGARKRSPDSKMRICKSAFSAEE